MSPRYVAVRTARARHFDRDRGLYTSRSKLSSTWNVLNTVSTQLHSHLGYASKSEKSPPGGAGRLLVLRERSEIRGLYTSFGSV